MPGRYETFTRDEWLARCVGQRRAEGGDATLADVGLVAGDVAVYRSLAGVVAGVAGVADVADGVRAAADGARGGRCCVVGIAGAVAAGKSTTARALQLLLAGGDGAPVVEVVATDGFLRANEDLARRGLLARKGFPESYDVGRLVRFLSEVRTGRAGVEVPVYSHEIYDVLPGQVRTLGRPDIVLVEGVNILHLADRLDFSIYVDADEADLERWYLERFLLLTAASGDEPSSFYRRFSTMDAAEVAAVAQGVWRTVNGVNLHEHIEPTRDRADLVIEKGPDHAVRRIRRRVP